MQTNPLKIAIIDNDEKLHPNYRLYFSNEPGFELIGIFTSTNALKHHPLQTALDIVVLEVALDGFYGMDGIQWIDCQMKKPKVLMLGSESNFATIKEAFKKGANGFLTKPLTKARFLEALLGLHQHGVALEHNIARKIVHSFQMKRFGRFSKKENQIIELLTQGYTYKMIADRLCVTPSAVNFHIQNIYVKLNVNSKAEALKKLQELETHQLNAA